ncbi:hypothetical protein LZ009_07825 [Ramlibacter sp. XY19]|uniref:hypothetical protein n=1 Tax=Ramlibacter paludis TaxID=2908000 RepID=UPI0023DCA41E|nr:hypothetical protein [Ramlibacter paludis]MCG2592690.1 hypothetical protein [Ramlibacter paludis]
MGNGKFAIILALLISVGVAAWPSATQRSVAHGVTVAVTPGNLDAGNGIWDFAIALESRGTRLNDELMDSVVLLGDGRQVKPLAWEGAGPGGSHRAGVLKFVALKPRPKELELRMQRPGEKAPRVFRFAFGEWSV